MNYLAIDTATEACSVALQYGDEVLQRYAVAPQQHAAIILPMIDEILSEAGLAASTLDGLVFGRGPGSFTGVRIATAAVQGIALGIDCGVIGVSTLEAMAHRSWRDQQTEFVLAAIDARMQQVYWGCYQVQSEGRAVLHGEEAVSDPGSLQLPEAALTATSQQNWHCIGTGAEQYAEQLRANGITCPSMPERILPAAIDLLLLARPRFANGEALPVDQIAPVYLRDKVAQTEAERLRGRTSVSD